MTTIPRRRSKYTEAVKYALNYYGHATNAQLAEDLRRSYPQLSDTTIHRITQRLVEDGIVQYGPNALDGAMVFDNTVRAHDHFQCQYCGELRDIDLPLDCRQKIYQSVGRVDRRGRLTIMGKCNKC